MTAIETGCPYILTAGSAVATLNVPSDPNFVGYVNEVTGLDMYGVRENAAQLASVDGGYHGAFYRDRRPWTIQGFIMPTTPIASRSAAQDKLGSVLGRCFRTDGVLQWTPSDGVQRGVYFRTQQPTRFSKGQANIQRTFLIACVTRDWRILKWAGSSVSATGVPTISLNATPGGNADAAPIFTVTGPVTNPIVINTTTGKRITFSGITIAAGHTLVINLQGTYPTILYDGVTDYSNYVDAVNSDYTIAVSPPGVNGFQLSGSSGSSATGLQIQWNDSWH